MDVRAREIEEERGMRQRERKPRASEIVFIGISRGARETEV